MKTKQFLLTLLLLLGGGKFRMGSKYRTYHRCFLPHKL